MVGLRGRSRDGGGGLRRAWLTLSRLKGLQPRLRRQRGARRDAAVAEAHDSNSYVPTSPARIGTVQGQGLPPTPDAPVGGACAGLDGQSATPWRRRLQRDAAHAGANDWDNPYRPPRSTTSEDYVKYSNMFALERRRQEIMQDRDDAQADLERRNDRAAARQQAAGGAFLFSACMSPQVDTPGIADVGASMREYAKREIMASPNTEELQMRMEILVDEDWLTSIDVLPGNIYTVLAFGSFFDSTQNFVYNLKAALTLCGCFLILIIQIVGPPLVFASKVSDVGILKEEMRYNWEVWPLSPSYNESIGAPMFFDWPVLYPTKVLAIMFVMVFTLNGLFFIVSFERGWNAVWRTFQYIDYHTNDFKLSGSVFLIAGALTNIWVVCWCSVSAFVVIGSSRAPTDLILDSMGLVFLFNLDDVSGDLGFISDDDWPGARLAWLYDCLQRDMDDDVLRGSHVDYLGCRGRIIMCLFRLCVFFLALCTFVFPILMTVTPFLRIAPA